MHITKNDIDNLDRITRLNLINSVSGIKPANLIGTISADEQTNLAIFSSVVHIGSNPPLMGFFIRPFKEVPRHTFENILLNGCYTINHISKDIIEKAHYTSAKFEKAVSEFEKCNLTEEFLFDFKAPFVKECKLKIALKLKETISITSNDTVLVVGEIHHIVLPDNALQHEGHINLSKIDNIGISGLNSYYELDKIAQYPYARTTNIPTF